MQIIRQHASALLFEKVRALGEQRHASWRCIYFNFASRQDHYSPGVRNNFVVRALADLLAHKDGFIYLCEDGDIFILFQGNFKSVAGKLSSQFGDLDPERLMQQEEDRLLTVFDLSQHWQFLHNVCRNKCLQGASAGKIPARQLASLRY